MAGLNLLFRHWPYPVRLTSGSITVSPQKVIVKDVQGQGPDRRQRQGVWAFRPADNPKTRGSSLS